MTDNGRRRGDAVYQAARFYRKANRRWVPRLLLSFTPGPPMRYVLGGHLPRCIAGCGKIGFPTPRTRVMKVPPMCNTRLQCVVVCCCLAAAMAAPVAAAEFRIENRVYSENQKEPSSRSTTIFHAGMV